MLSLIIGLIIGLHFGIRIGMYYACRDADKLLSGAKKMMDKLRKQDILFKKATSALCDNRIDDFVNICATMREARDSQLRRNDNG